MKPRTLVAYDFSPESDRALRWAADLQRSLECEVHVVHVVNPLPAVSAAAPVPMVIPQDQVDGLDDALREAITRRELRATSEVLFAPAFGDAILHVAKQFRAELIVMGTHGRSGWKRLALGSVADEVVRHADCPVVTMRAPPT